MDVGFGPLWSWMARSGHTEATFACPLWEHADLAKMTQSGHE